MDEEPASGPLTRLGVPQLWRNDPELLWRYVLGPLVAPFIHLLAPSYAYGVERVPATGGAVLAANHLAAIDHPLLGLFSRRSIYFVSKEELLEIPGFGEFLRWAGTVPVRRGEADRDALRRARELVREGRVVGVHPEGTRQRTGYPGPMKAGAVAIALAEGVPVVPCGLETFRWSVRNRRACAVVFGRPIAFDDIPRGPDRRATALREGRAGDRPPLARRRRGRGRRLPRAPSRRDAAERPAAAERASLRCIPATASTSGSATSRGPRWPAGAEADRRAAGRRRRASGLAAGRCDRVPLGALRVRSPPRRARPPARERGARLRDHAPGHGRDRRAARAPARFPSTSTSRRWPRELELVASSIRPETRALLVTPLFGTTVELEPYAEIARANGLLLLEDCAQSLHEPGLRGDPHADASLFSFGPIKTATALGGAVVRVRDPELRERMRRTLAGWPLQPRRQFLARVLKFAALSALARPFLFGAFVRICERRGREVDDLLSSFVRGFKVPYDDPAFTARIRRRPCGPLLRLLRRRLTSFDRDRLARRAALGERLARSLPATFLHPGSGAPVRSHWVFPVLTADPAALIAALRRRGLDAAPPHATSAMTVVAAPAERPETEAAAARWLMEHVVFLPAYPELPERAVRRLLATLQEVGASTPPVAAPPRPTRAGTLVG